jgi:hypothetical protein
MPARAIWKGVITFGDVHFNVPPGWRHVERQSGASRFLLMVPQNVAEKESVAILLLPGQELQGADFPQAFDRILKQGLAASEHLVQYSGLPLRKAAGYDFLTRAMVVADDAGRRSFRVCFGANPGHRLEILIVSASSQEVFKRYEADLALLLNSLSFGDASVSAETKNEESGATARIGPGARTEEDQERGNTAIDTKTATPGTRARVPEGESVLLCSETARLDFAMDAARDGRGYDARQALRHDTFFRVTGPASVEVRESELKSRWPKVFVRVLNGDSAGRTGWVLWSELKNLSR